MKEKLQKAKGFTLVELLIVIALIAVLSVAVLATINPIEQANKARDARVQNDAAEVMNAAERYYASVSKYPWESYVDNLTSSNSIVIRSDKIGFGVCNGSGVVPTTLASTVVATSCTASDAFPNLLISTSELKASFAGKDEFGPVFTAPAKPAQALWLVKAASANSFYVCYIPKANANRVVDENMRCVSDVGVITKVSAAGPCVKATTAQWTTAATNPDSFIVAAPVAAIFRCVPE